MFTFLPLHQLLTEGRAADHPVCHDGQRDILWAEFAARITAEAATLQPRSESRWLLTHNDPLDFVCSFLALLHAGKQIVIPPNTQPGTLERINAEFDVDTSVLEKIPVDTVSRVTTPINPQITIIDLYTSGSTGEPKRVRKTLTQFEAEIVTLENLWGKRLGNTTVIATVPHHHIYGLLFRLLWPLSAGRAFDNITCTQPDMLRDRLTMLGNATLVSSPAQLSRLPELQPLTSLTPVPQFIFSSGSPLSNITAAAFHQQLGQAPTEIYGSTETGGIAWRQQENNGSGDAWTPFPGVYVSNDNDGALSLRSPFLPDMQPRRTDDAADLLPDGRFHLHGRLDRIVKVEGKRLSLPDMEMRLLAHPWVAEAAVIMLTGRRQSVGVALVLSTAGRSELAAASRREIAQVLRLYLGAYFETVLLPRYWRFPERLPLNERGKLTSTALAALFSGEQDARAAA